VGHKRRKNRDANDASNFRAGTGTPRAFDHPHFAMLSKLITAFCLMAFCVAIHAMGMIALFHRIHVILESEDRGFWQSTWFLIRVAAWTLFLHLLQILTWALSYRLNGAITDFTTAAYFSGITYTTTGYGDIVLPEEWRVVGGVEALTGILMCGVSTGMFFAVFSRIFHFTDGRRSTR
jgi:Ion channel